MSLEIGVTSAPVTSDVTQICFLVMRDGVFLDSGQVVFRNGEAGRDIRLVLHDDESPVVAQLKAENEALTAQKEALEKQMEDLRLRCLSRGIDDRRREF